MTPDTDWCHREDGCRGIAPIKRDTLEAGITPFLVVLSEPTRAVARVTIRQQWGGVWSITPERIWTAPEEDDDGA
jgi:hypothetical protein